MKGPYEDLRHYLGPIPGLAWLAPLLDEGEQVLGTATNGHLPRWKAALDALPDADMFLDGQPPAPVLGRPVADADSLRETLMELHPWRKGPLVLGGVRVDAEWRSDLKWARLADRMELRGHRVLDIGSGNGYYGWRMLGQGAECVVGIDPTLVHVMQWMASLHFAGKAHNYVLPIGVADLPEDAGNFDSVFSMGVLYHRRDPARHLNRLRRLVRDGGQVIVETLVLDGDTGGLLVPDGRYARMRNVWSVPGLDRLLGWMANAGLRDVEILDVSRTTTREQRSTEWMRFESLQECLDPGDSSRTIEGYPGPMRAALLARRP